MKRLSSIISILTMGTMLLAPSSYAMPFFLPATAGSPQADLYAQGTAAINQEHWQDAIRIFGKVEQQHGAYAAGALYWKAYAENREGRPAQALIMCGELRKQYPTSSWLEECSALEIRVRSKSGAPVAPQSEPNEDLKLLAMNALMQQDPSQAVPILQQLLESNQPQDIKHRALFLLAQNRSSEGQALLAKIAQGQSGTKLQINAIRLLAMAGGKQAAAKLGNIYGHTSNEAVKKAILQSYFLTGNSGLLLQAARQEKYPELARAAVQSLGVMGATDDLISLYHATGSNVVKSGIINALVTSGSKGANALSEIAGSEQNSNLRQQAIRNLGIAGGASKASELVAIYQKSSDIATKKTAAQALFLSGDAHDLIVLVRSEQNPKLKEYLVRELSLMHSPEATQYMLQLLNK